jgi:hypothetical protein
MVISYECVAAMVRLRRAFCAPLEFSLVRAVRLTMTQGTTLCRVEKFAQRSTDRGPQKFAQNRGVKVTGYAVGDYE